MEKEYTLHFPSKTAEEATARWRQTCKDHHASCLSSVPVYQKYLDTATEPGMLKVVMNGACQYYVVRVRDGAIITGNGKTGRTPKILRGMMEFLAGALS